MNTKATARDHAEKRFWKDVEELLIRKHHHSKQLAKKGIQQYRNEINCRLGSVLYNQGEELTARVVDRIVRDGLPGS